MDVREYTEVFPSALPARRASRHHAWVSIATGCDNHCTFCIVPLVRGPQRSRAIGDVLAEVQGLARDGVLEVTLLGQNVNTYGRDLTIPGSGSRPQFGRLLREVDAIEGIRRIRFTSPHPHDFTPDVIEAMAESASVCEHIHFPLQSGSDRVLREMQRSYRAGRYLGWLERIRAAIPDVAVTTDIIVGFPGETEADFGDTLRVVEEARFDAAFTFQYSPRPGTAAFGREDLVRPDAVRDRFDRLVELQERISLERNRALRGPGRGGPCGGSRAQGRAQARTRTNLVVNVAEPLEPGTFSEVRVTAAHPHHLDRRPCWSPSRVPASRGTRSSARPPPARPTRPSPSPPGLGAEIAEHRLHARLPGDGRRDREADAGGAGPGPAPSDRPRRTRRDVLSLRVPAGRRCRARPAGRPRGPAPPGGGLRPLLPRGRRRALRSRGPIPGPAGSWRSRARWSGAPALHERLRSFDPAAAEQIEPGNLRRTVRALEVAALTGRPFSSFAAAWDEYPGSELRAAGVHMAAPVLYRRIEDRVDAMLAAGWLDEVRGLVERGFGASLTSRQAIGYAELVAHLEGRTSLDEARASTMKRTKALARRQIGVVPAGPPHSLVRSGGGGRDGRDRGREGALRVMRIAKYHGTGNDFVVRRGPRRPRARRARR